MRQEAQVGLFILPTIKAADVQVQKKKRIQMPTSSAGDSPDQWVFKLYKHLSQSQVLYEAAG